MDQERLILLVMVLLWAVNLTVIIRRAMAWWRRTGKDSRPIRIVDYRDEDWMPYALLAEMLENERLRHDRDDKP